jgi:hypothetical protein
MHKDILVSTPLCRCGFQKEGFLCAYQVDEAPAFSASVLMVRELLEREFGGPFDGHEGVRTRELVSRNHKTKQYLIRPS